jgi:hypothetical protein
MMRLKSWLLAGGMAAVLSLSANDLLAQNNGGGNGGGRGNRGGGNFDPARFQQQMMDRYKEQLEFKDDAEWKAVQPLIQKVSDARMASFRGGRRGPGGGNNNNNTNPDADALQKAIDAKASNAELKAAVTKFVEARKVKQADLEKAQNDLRKVLTVRQEAIATSIGLL